MHKGIVYRPSLSNTSADLVIVGGGPAGIYLTEAIQQYIPQKFFTIVLEQKDVLGGTSEASLQQFRTYQGVQSISRVIQDTVNWYNSLSNRIFQGNQSLIDTFPYLFLAENKQDFERLEQLLSIVQTWGFGNGATMLTSSEVQFRHPFIDGPIAGALYYPEAGRLDFDRAMTEIVRHCSENTMYAVGTQLQQVLVQNNKVIGVRTDLGEIIRTDTIVLTPGPFLLKILPTIPNALRMNINDIFYLQQRQHFGSSVGSLPPNTKMFIISADGSYVRLSVGINGQGEGIYGFADPTDPHVSDPLWIPTPNDFEFPAEVYYRLGSVMSMYADQPNFGIPSNRRKPLYNRAGYYAHAKDDLFIVSPTDVQGLYILAGLEGLGIMAGKGCADLMAQILFQREPENNPFSLRRDFDKEKSSVIL